MPPNVGPHLTRGTKRKPPAISGKPSGLLALPLVGGRAAWSGEERIQEADAAAGSRSGSSAGWGEEAQQEAPSRPPRRRPASPTVRSFRRLPRRCEVKAP